MCVATAAIAFTLAGCDSDRQPGREALLATLSDVETRNPIEAVEQTPRFEVEIGRNGSDDAGAGKLELARFLHKYRRSTRVGPLYISSPGHGYRSGRDNVDVSAALHDLRHAIRAAGIADAAVVFSSRDGAGPIIQLSYRRLAAVAQPCGDWSENADLNRDNLPYPNFGCAVQSNMAAMIARPTDVVYPAPETPRPAERRANDQKKYNEGSLVPDGKSSVSTR